MEKNAEEDKRVARKCRSELVKNSASIAVLAKNSSAPIYIRGQSLFVFWPFSHQNDIERCCTLDNINRKCFAQSMFL